MAVMFPDWAWVNLLNLRFGLVEGIPNGGFG